MEAQASEAAHRRSVKGARSWHGCLYQRVEAFCIGQLSAENVADRALEVPDAKRTPLCFWNSIFTSPIARLGTSAQKYFHFC